MTRLAALAAALIVGAASAAQAGPILQGTTLNGARFNGPILQGMRMNGEQSNGPILQGIKLQGLRMNGTSAGEGMGGLVLRGVTLGGGAGQSFSAD